MNRFDLHPKFREFLNAAIETRTVDASSLFVMRHQTPKEAADEIIEAAFSNRHSPEGQANHRRLVQLFDEWRSLLADDADRVCEGHPAGEFDSMGETVFCVVEQLDEIADLASGRPTGGEEMIG